MYKVFVCESVRDYKLRLENPHKKLAISFFIFLWLSLDVSHRFWLRYIFGAMSVKCECEWIANADTNMRIYAWIKQQKHKQTDLIAVSEFQIGEQQNIMQLSCIMTLDLKQLRHREDLRKTLCCDCSTKDFCSLSRFADAQCIGKHHPVQQHLCFIHNNLCYCVLGHHFVYIVFRVWFCRWHRCGEQMSLKCAYVVFVMYAAVGFKMHVFCVELVFWKCVTSIISQQLPVTAPDKTSSFECVCAFFP